MCAITAKPFASQDKKEIVVLHSLFDVGLLTDLTNADVLTCSSDHEAILDSDAQTFSKQGLYIVQFCPVASVVNNHILIDNKLAIPFKLRAAIFTRLHQSHP